MSESGNQNLSTKTNQIGNETKNDNGIQSLTLIKTSVIRPMDTFMVTPVIKTAPIQDDPTSRKMDYSDKKIDKICKELKFIEVNNSLFMCIKNNQVIFKSKLN